MDDHTEDSKKSPYTNFDYSSSELYDNYLHVWKHKMTSIFEQEKILHSGCHIIKICRPNYNTNCYKCSSFACHWSWQHC